VRAPRKPVLYTSILQGVVPACVRKGLIIMEGWLMVLYIHIYIFSSFMLECRRTLPPRFPPPHHPSIALFLFFYSAHQRQQRHKYYNTTHYIYVRGNRLGGKLFTYIHSCIINARTSTPRVSHFARVVVVRDGFTIPILYMIYIGIYYT